MKYTLSIHAVVIIMSVISVDSVIADNRMPLTRDNAVLVQGISEVAVEGELLFEYGKDKSELVVHSGSTISVTTKQNSSCLPCAEIIALSPNMKVPLSIFRDVNVSNVEMSKTRGYSRTRTRNDDLMLSYSSLTIDIQSDPRTYVISTGQAGARIKKIKGSFRLLDGEAFIIPRDRVYLRLKYNDKTSRYGTDTTFTLIGSILPQLANNNFTVYVDSSVFEDELENMEWRSSISRYGVYAAEGYYRVGSGLPSNEDYILDISVTPVRSPSYTPDQGSLRGALLTGYAPKAELSLSKGDTIIMKGKVIPDFKTSYTGGTASIWVDGRKKILEWIDTYLPRDNW